MQLNYYGRNEIQEALMRYLAGIFPDGVVNIDINKDKTQLCYVYRPFDGRIVKFLFSNGEIMIPDNYGDEEKILTNFLNAIKTRGIKNV